MHYPDLGSASDWLKENSLIAQPIRSTTKIWVVDIISMEFCARYSDIALQGLKWRPHETSAVFSGYI